MNASLKHVFLVETLRGYDKDMTVGQVISVLSDELALAAVPIHQELVSDVKDALKTEKKAVKDALKDALKTEKKAEKKAAKDALKDALKAEKKAVKDTLKAKAKIRYVLSKIVRLKQAYNVDVGVTRRGWGHADGPDELEVAFSMVEEIEERAGLVPCGVRGN